MLISDTLNRNAYLSMRNEMAKRVIAYISLGILAGLYSYKVAIMLVFVVGLLDFWSYITTKKHHAQLKIDRQQFLEKHNQTLSFHITEGRKNQQFYETYRDLIDSLVDEVVLTTRQSRGWKPWPLFIPIKQSVAQPFLLYVSDGKFYCRSIKHLVQLHLNSSISVSEVEQSIKKAVEELKALQPPN